ncbi:MAG: hypothetical protein AB1755_02205 [Candidatus Omnitrophota bacterium]
MSKHRKLISFFAIISILTLVSLIGIKLRAEDKKTAYPVFQKGMIFATWNKDTYASFSSQDSLKQLSDMGVNWVAILTTWYQNNYNTPKIKKSTKTPSDESLIHAIKTAHDLGMKVMLKPHIDLIDGSDGKWRADIDFATQEEWDAWFVSYKEIMLHYAQLAQDNDVEMICIGTELTRAAVDHSEKWVEMIREIRSIYTKGYLTYAANWYEEFNAIKFWGELDYVGIDAYFPLTASQDPSLEQLISDWQPWVKQVEEFAAKINKPIIFPEVGYKSVVQTADSPWEHISNQDINLDLQARCYEALLEVFWDKPWFYGAYWWYWGTSTKMGGKTNKGFTPQNKPAAEIINKWYKEKQTK